MYFVNPKLKIVLLSILLFLIAINSFSQTTIASYDFESSDQNWTGGNKTGWYSTLNSCSGTKALRIETSGVNSYLNSEALDLSNYTSVNFSFCHNSSGIVNGEGFKVLYYNGSSWSSLTYIKGTDWTDDGPNNFTVIINGGGSCLPSNAEFRFEGYLGGNSDYNYFDDVLVEGYLGAEDINIKGNGVSIANGDTVPNVADDTDFGSVVVGNTVSNVFTIENVNIGSLLNLTGIPDLVSISGDASFTITAQPASSSVNGCGSSVTFTVQYNPAAVGTHTATVTILNSDGVEGTYTFDVQGTATPTPPEINIQGNGTSIADGETVTSLVDHTNFGDVGTGSSFTRTFTIENTGGDDLTIGSTVTLATGTLFTLTTQPASTLLTTGTSTTFVITFSPVAEGTFTDVVTITSDDSNENPYTFTISGNGVIFLTEGPGGVVSNLQLWLKSDKGITKNGSNGVTTWATQGRGSNATVNTAGQEPTYRDDAAYNVNFNPVVEFSNAYSSVVRDTDFSFDDITTQFLEGNTGFYSQDIFVVFIPDNTPINNTFGFMDMFCGDADISTNEEDATGIGLGDYSGRADGEIIMYAHSTYSSSTPGDGYAVSEIGTGSSYNNVGIINAYNNSTLPQQELSYNANDIGTTQNNSIDDMINVNDTKFWIGRSEGWEASLNARIAEIITYSSRKNDITERNRIESYLGIKYGITLGVNGTSQDYVDSSGNIIWDQSVNSGYNYDIAGIGRDDDSELNQKQSKSVNNAFDVDGPTQGILTIGLTDIYATNKENITANSLNTFGNKQFLVWGDNGVNLNLAASTINVDMSAGISGLSTPVTFTGIQRIWKVVETGIDVPKVKVSIPTNAVRNINPPGSFLMFISDTDVFDPTADYRVMTEIGDNLYADYDFDGTKYITFGYAPEIIVERSIYFDGVVDYVDMEDALNLNASEFTVSAWVKRGAGSSNTSIFSKRDIGYTEGYDFKITSANKVEMSWGNSGAQKITSNTTIPQDEWHQVAVIYSVGSAKLYIDGILDETQSLTIPVATTQSFFIAAAGKNSPTAHFEGNIDEVRIWDVALSVDQLRYIMNQELIDKKVITLPLISGNVVPTTITKNEISSIPWSSLAGYYPLSVYTYTNTNDMSGNGHQGALRNLNTVDWQTAPLPYESTADGAWGTPATWLNNTVQSLPNSASIVNPSISIDWNIVQTTHNITSGDRDITVLGLKNNVGKITMASTGALDETNNGQGLTVTHYLEIDGEIDLVGESQLVQTEGSILDEDSGGSLERDQQGTANSFNYNYWSSSVGPVLADPNTKNTRGTGVESINASNLISVALKDGTDSSNPLFINFDTPYTWADNAYTGSKRISSYWLYTFNGTSDDYNSWVHVNQNSPILPGEGYTMKGTDGLAALSDRQNYVFKGKPYNGDFKLYIDAGDDRLIGNPYPSAMDAHEFILDNLSGRHISGKNIFNGALYFWDHFGEKNSHVLKKYVGGYATLNLTAGAPAISNDYRIDNSGVSSNDNTLNKIPGQYIPVNQGFFVYTSLDTALTGLTTVDGGDIVFNNSQRIFKREGTASSVFMKGTNSKKGSVNNKETIDLRPKIRLQYDSPNGYHRQIVVGTDENASNNFDLGYDAPIADVNAEDMFWILNESKFVIQGVHNFNADQELPLGLKLEIDGLVRIKIEALENIDENLSLYIKDSLTGEIHNINSLPFEINLAAGEYLDRFSLVFQSQKTLDVEEEILNSGIQVFMNNTISELQIRKRIDTEILSVKMYNYLGQTIHNWTSKLTSNEISLPIKAASGVYFVQINTKTGKLNKKIIIK